MLKQNNERQAACEPQSCDCSLPTLTFCTMLMRLAALPVTLAIFRDQRLCSRGNGSRVRGVMAAAAATAFAAQRQYTYIHWQAMEAATGEVPLVRPCLW